MFLKMQNWPLPKDLLKSALKGAKGVMNNFRHINRGLHCTPHQKEKFCSDTYKRGKKSHPDMLAKNNARSAKIHKIKMKK